MFTMRPSNPMSQFGCVALLLALTTACGSNVDSDDGDTGSAGSSSAGETADTGQDTGSADAAESSGSGGGGSDTGGGSDSGGGSDTGGGSSDGSTDGSSSGAADSGGSESGGSESSSGGEQGTVLWEEDFEAYDPASEMHGQGGWKGWGNNDAAGALVSSDQAHSPTQSVAIEGGSDLVHEFADVTSGLVEWSAWQYIPSTMTGETWFVMMNTYTDNGFQLDWSIQIEFDATNDVLTNQGNTGGTLALVEDAWVEIRVLIDLDNDTHTFYYDDQELYTGGWTTENSDSGALAFEAVDLFANGASEAYYDDCKLTALQ
jgi:hypothetical protein